MSDWQKEFEQATEDVQKLNTRPDNATLLKLYALFKQATEGDIEGKRPGLTDLVGRAKYDSWSALKHMSKEQARQAYIELVRSLAAN